MNAQLKKHAHSEDAGNNGCGKTNGCCGCVVPDTRVRMADGSEKEIRYVRCDDMVRTE